MGLLDDIGKNMMLWSHFKSQNHGQHWAIFIHGSQYKISQALNISVFIIPHLHSTTKIHYSVNEIIQ